MIVTYAYLSGRPQQFETQAESILIGRLWRSQTVDLDLSPDNTVSRRHARLSREDNEYWLEDLGSTGGTWVNGQKIAAKTRLSPDDEITVGQTWLQVVVESSPPETEADILEGLLTSSVSATDSPATMLLAAASLEIVNRRLTTFYDLGEALSTLETVEALLQTVVQYLRRAIPRAQRSALLLRDEQGLRLKVHSPEQLKPAVSYNLARRAVEKQEAFTWRLSQTEETSKPFESVLLHGTKCAMYAPLIWKGEVLGVVFVDNFEMTGAFAEDDLRLLMAMASQAAMFVKNHTLQQDLRRQEVIRSNLLRQFSPQVADRLEQMLLESDYWHLGGQRTDPVTILVSDVRGFTSLSARMDPDDVVEMLNELFAVCIPIIFKYDGTVDKYVGDSILAVFGSPEPDKRQWENAVRASLEMQQAIRVQQEVWQKRKLPVYRIGIGIHTGAVLHGFIGAPERMEFTVIGDAVNRATRFCDGAEGGEVIISPEVFARVANSVEAIPKIIRTKHPESEPDMAAYIVKAWNAIDTSPLPAVSG